MPPGEWKGIDEVFQAAEDLAAPQDLRELERQAALADLELLELAQKDEKGQEEGESDGREDSATGRDEARETHEAREA